ncbi:putative centrin [Gregarina niphandrodes]|uniref:Centrin n=1 Tax=Gregarina niphandrodes TaxID=110365 RepID=A0A023B0I8_GRENI|nr:putative centrin [Gregarina niphandrodes]EZG44370.1 putative centrin [Gregarina niphandrodes]|eukprot:XP_011132685.1 putative centrin [Gregarina niphandrodes]
MRVQHILTLDVNSATLAKHIAEIVGVDEELEVHKDVAARKIEVINSIVTISISRAQLKQLFDIFDVEKTGYIDARELKAGLRALGCYLTPDRIREGLRSVGITDISAPISFETFCAMAEPLLPKLHSRESYQQLFDILAGDGGFLTLSHLKQLCEELKEPIPDDELQRMIYEADQDGDGRVSFEDFMRIMTIANDPLAE